MHNDPELSGKYLGTISADFVKVADSLKEASYRIRKGGFEYPVFAIAKEPIPIGQLLLEQAPGSRTWSYYVSLLDELVQRGIVDKEKEQSFKDSYKDPDEFCCLFVVDKEFTNFVFIPYPED
jgi:hypothetical protein